MSGALLRPSRADDVAAIQAIYAHHVATGTASFELEAPTLAEMAARREAILARSLPYLAAEREGRLVGYAYAAPYRPRPAYRFTVEDSIYLAPDAIGHGIGRLLLDGLIEACTGLGQRQMVAVIGDSGQVPSIRLHERCGFDRIGVVRDVGWKFGRWLDTVIMQRALGPGAGGPPAA